MKAIVNTEPSQLMFMDVPLLIPGAGEVRVKTAACGICATDLAMVAGWERTGFPAIPGHEWAGVVDTVGENVDPALVGHKCVAENVLSDGGEVGFEHPGGYGEYLVTEVANLHVLPDSYPMHVAALIEPLAVVVRAMHRLRLDDRASALVFGDGPIGLLAVGLLRLNEVDDIVLIGGRRGRLDIGASLGATHTLNYHELGADLATAVRTVFPNPFPNVIEASGSRAALRTGLELAAASGKIVVAGDYGNARADFAWNQLLHREIELIGSNASAGAWPEAVRTAVEGDLPLDRLVTHRLSVEEFIEGVELTRGHHNDVIKVVLEW